MFWQTKGGTDYLAVKTGARSSQTEAIYESFVAEKETARKRVTNAFAAYEVLCGVKFPAGNEPTQDFDLAWSLWWNSSGSCVERRPL